MVTLLLAGAALASAAPTAPDWVTRWRPYTEVAAARCGVPIAWIERVMRAESGGQTRLAGRPIASRAGAMGLMQVMPTAWADLRARLFLGADPYDPRDNIVAGSCYLRSMYDRFGYPGLFAAYNAGPVRYTDYLATGRPLPRETRDYIALVGGPSDSTVPAPDAPPASGLFYILRSVSQPDGRTRSDALFFKLAAAAAPGK